MRLPRFNLGVVLILTAIVAVIAWQASIVRERKAAMQSINAAVIHSCHSGPDGGDKAALLSHRTFAEMGKR